VFVVRKCPVCSAIIREFAEDFCFCTVRDGAVIRVAKQLNAEVPEGNRVYEIHERCVEAFTLQL
jgi:hypothetical protein